MITGTVNANLQPIILVPIFSGGGVRHEIEAMVDTGYNGWLALPPDLINRQFFAWSIRMVVEPAIFVQTFVLVAVTSLLAGLWPARHAAGRAPAEAMRLE